MTDRYFLEWLYERLINKYGEDRNVDFVQRLGKIAEEAKAEPEPYLLDYRMSAAHLATIFEILKHEGQVTIKLGTPGPGKCDPVMDWHQIELAVIAAHERRVRGQ